MIRIGIMGCGNVAQYAHLYAIDNTKKLQLVSAFDPNPQRLRELRKKARQDVQPFTDVEGFFASGIDAVAVTSAAPAHLQNVLDAACHGKHVLCEKPLAMNDRDARTMITAMKNARKMLFTGFCYRFSPCALKIKELVDKKAIGRIRALRLIYIWGLHGRWEKLPDGTLADAPHYDGRMLEGGPMVDCGVHQIDLARWWLGGDVVRQQPVGLWVEKYDAPDHMYLHMDHAGGAKTTVEISYSYTHTAVEPISHFSYHLIGTEGIIRYDREHKVFEMRNSTGTHSYPWHDEKNFGGMYDAFVTAIETGKPGHLATGEDGLIATRIARTATEEVIGMRSSVGGAIGIGESAPPQVEDMPAPPARKPPPPVGPGNYPY